jgi:hypothetical protein
MAHSSAAQFSLPSTVEDESTQAHAKTAMKALAQLFVRNSAQTLGPEDVSPREVLLGLSAFFKAIAAASEPDSTSDIELGLCNSTDPACPGIIVLVIQLMFSRFRRSVLVPTNSSLSAQ